MRRIAAGERGPLLGIPLIHKDIFCTDGVKTSCGSRMLDNFVCALRCDRRARLKAAGAVMLGKSNMDEFAMGSSNETSYYGPVKNPWDIEQGARRLLGRVRCRDRGAPRTLSATGTDTGGSIRQPAALTGVTGIKPTYGRVSRYGMIAFASSLDQAGVFARSAGGRGAVLQGHGGVRSARIRPVSMCRCPIIRGPRAAAQRPEDRSCCGSSSRAWSRATPR